MTSLVGTDDLKDWLGVSTINEARAELLLELASDLVRSELGQVLDYVEDDEVEVTGRGSTVHLLRELPVWEVSSVEEARRGSGTFVSLLELVDFGLELGEDHRTGIIRRLNGRWAAGATYRITYTHGYGTIAATGDSVIELPGAIKAVILRVATRAYTNPSSNRQESIGRYSYTAGGDTPGLAMTAGDRHDLDAFYPGHRAGAK